MLLNELEEVIEKLKEILNWEIAKNNGDVSKSMPLSKVIDRLLNIHQMLKPMCALFAKKEENKERVSVNINVFTG